MPDDPDLPLLQRFAKGDNAALGELARRYEQPLLGLALGIVNNRELARDAVQDMWVRVIRAAASFQAQSSVRTWMYRILINRAITLRQAAARKPVSTTFPEADAATAVHAGEEAERIRTAVRELPENQQLILLLAYHEGLTHEAAADVLGIPLGTLKSRLHAALTALRAKLGAEVVA
ncbi:MAG TPA: sigma-70 family RNA polymerase sigma factor [Phycisphaerales bacterium]|nr:sigma-70 family RNA polymerase sigma factor [Phycisphaerales bacterium]